MPQKGVFDMKMANFVLDVDGVLAKPDVLYSAEGKAFKVFGPDDHDALNLLRDRINIEFVTSDKRGFDITKKRVVDDMKYPLSLSSNYKRIEWMREKFKLEETIYMGDGIFDAEVFKKVGYAICTSDGFYLTRQQADFVTTATGGNRAVAEACVHILNKFFHEYEIKPNTGHGIWKEEEKK